MVLLEYLASAFEIYTLPNSVIFNKKWVRQQDWIPSSDSDHGAEVCLKSAGLHLL